MGLFTISSRMPVCATQDPERGDLRTEDVPSLDAVARADLAELDDGEHHLLAHRLQWRGGFEQAISWDGTERLLAGQRRTLFVVLTIR
jgi:hypothetical protein